MLSTVLFTILSIYKRFTSLLTQVLRSVGFKLAIIIRMNILCNGFLNNLSSNQETVKIYFVTIKYGLPMISGEMLLKGRIFIFLNVLEHFFLYSLHCTPL